MGKTFHSNKIPHFHLNKVTRRVKSIKVFLFTLQMFLMPYVERKLHNVSYLFLEYFMNWVLKCFTKNFLGFLGIF